MKRENFFRPSEEVRDPYHYTACGLQNIYLLNGYDFGEHDGERHVFIRSLDALHQAIGRHLVLKRKALTGAEIKFLRKTIDLTQEELAEALGNNAQSIARWEKGQITIPGDAEKLLRVVFFARLTTEEELRALRDLIVDGLVELDAFDEDVTPCASFTLNETWTEQARPVAVCC